jgi:glutamate-1-semialdehyde 2,1-aminomutase
MAGPQSAPTAFAQSAGIPEGNACRVVILPFNSPEDLEEAFAAHGREAAALILEPVNYDSGCITPKPGFIALCRELCNRFGVLLIFDEVLTAFRLGLGGAQEYFGVVPDLAVLGKALGAGMPLSAIVGKREVMSNLRPLGASEHSGTYMAHLTAVMAAGAALAEYGQEAFYGRLHALGDRLYRGLEGIATRAGIPVRIQHLGPRFGMYFGITREVTNYREAAVQDQGLMDRFIAACHRNGVYFHVSPHHGFSAAHTEAVVDEALERIEMAMRELRQQRGKGGVN